MQGPVFASDRRDYNNFFFYWNGVRSVWLAFSAVAVFAFCGFSEY